MWYMSLAPFCSRRGSVSLGWMDVTMCVWRRERVIPRTNAWRPSRSDSAPNCGVLRPDVVRPKPSEKITVSRSIPAARCNSTTRKDSRPGAKNSTDSPVSRSRRCTAWATRAACIALAVTTAKDRSGCRSAWAKTRSTVRWTSAVGACTPSLPAVSMPTPFTTYSADIPVLTLVSSEACGTRVRVPS